jgi:hypothetical protein
MAAMTSCHSTNQIKSLKVFLFIGPGVPAEHHEPGVNILPTIRNIKISNNYPFSSSDSQVNNNHTVPRPAGAGHHWASRQLLTKRYHHIALQ